MELQQELLQRIEGAEAVLRAALAEGHHMWLQASDAQKTRLVELIGKVRPQGQLLVHVVQKVQMTSFAADHAQELNVALAASSTSPGSNGKWKAQDFTKFPYYFSDDVWANLKAPGGDIFQHARMVLGCLIHLGLKTPSEGTMAYVMA